MCTTELCHDTLFWDIVCTTELCHDTQFSGISNPGVFDRNEVSGADGSANTRKLLVASFLPCPTFWDSTERENAQLVEHFSDFGSESQKGGFQNNTQVFTSSLAGFIPTLESLTFVGHAFYIRYADLLILNSLVLTVALFGALVLAHK